MVDGAAAAAAGVPVLRRFSGGGTVVVDGDTQLVALIVAQSALPDVAMYPAPIMGWSETLYGRVFDAPRTGFALRENGAHSQERPPGATRRRAGGR